MGSNNEDNHDQQPQPGRIRRLLSRIGILFGFNPPANTVATAAQQPIATLTEQDFSMRVVTNFGIRPTAERNAWVGVASQHERDYAMQQAEYCEHLTEQIPQSTLYELVRAGAVFINNVMVTEGMIHQAVRDHNAHNLTVAEALFEITRSASYELREHAVSAEQTRRHERQIQNRRARQDNSLHPLHSVLASCAAQYGHRLRGYAVNGLDIMRYAIVSEQVRNFLDVICNVCATYGNITGGVYNSELLFSTNFTPRLDTPAPAITVNITEPVAISVLLWNDLDGTWHCRPNVVGSAVSRVAIEPYRQPSQDAEVIRNQETPAEDRSRSINLD